jgi:hypothetical protein
LHSLQRLKMRRATEIREIVMPATTIATGIAIAAETETTIGIATAIATANGLATVNGQDRRRWGVARAVLDAADLVVLVAVALVVADLVVSVAAGLPVHLAIVPSAMNQATPVRAVTPGRNCAGDSTIATAGRETKCVRADEVQVDSAALAHRHMDADSADHSVRREVQAFETTAVRAPVSKRSHASYEN